MQKTTSKALRVSSYQIATFLICGYCGLMFTDGDGFMEIHRTGQINLNNFLTSAK